MITWRGIGLLKKKKNTPNWIFFPTALKLWNFIICIPALGLLVWGGVVLEIGVLAGISSAGSSALFPSSEVLFVFALSVPCNFLFILRSRTSLMAFAIISIFFCLRVSVMANPKIAKRRINESFDLISFIWIYLNSLNFIQ